MKNFNSNTNNNDEWLTPPHIIHALGAFDLDPCAPIKRPWDMAAHHYTVFDDGLSKMWSGRVWLNPPYGRNVFRWLHRLSEHDGGGIALIFARTETQGFHKYIWNRAKGIFFFKGRLRFHHVDGSQGGTANAPSALVAYHMNDCAAIQQARSANLLRGKMVLL